MIAAATRFSEFDNSDARLMALWAIRVFGACGVIPVLSRRSYTPDAGEAFQLERFVDNVKIVPYGRSVLFPVEGTTILALEKRFWDPKG